MLSARALSSSPRRPARSSARATTRAHKGRGSLLGLRPFLYLVRPQDAYLGPTMGGLKRKPGALHEMGKGKRRRGTRLMTGFLQHISLKSTHLFVHFIGSSPLMVLCCAGGEQDRGFHHPSAFSLAGPGSSSEGSPAFFWYSAREDEGGH